MKFSIARHKWLESEEGKRSRQGFADGKYLMNRLDLAFAAGWNARQESVKPMVDAVEKYARWCDGEEQDMSTAIAKQVYDDLLSEARKLKEVK